MQTPRTEFAQALHAIAQERGLDPNVILDTIKQAIIAAYKRDAREQGVEVELFDYDVDLDSGNGEARVYAWPVAPVDPENPPSEEELQKQREEGMKVKKDVTPPGFGRIAAQTAKQVIHQKIREAEKGAVMDEYSVRVGTVITGMILRFDGPDVRVDLGRTEGLMPKEERVPNERLNANQRLSFLLKEIAETLKGKQLILSRADALFVHKLFEREVPEISSGSVEVKAIAREAGVRTKMAVFSNQSGVDPVGSCVGQKGVRVQAVTNELGGERVDIIPWTEDIKELIKASLAPAENLVVTLSKKEKMAVVSAPADQLSLAIGKEGQNARLAAKLTGWRIEIKESAASIEASAKQAKSEAKASEETEEPVNESVAEPTNETEKAEVKDAAVVDDASATPQVQADDAQVKTEEPKVEEVETPVVEEPKLEKVKASEEVTDKKS